LNVQSDKTPPDSVSRRRKRTPVRRVPTVINEPERRPFLFGLGGDLNHRERDALKERVALFGGIALAVVVAAILGWGLLHDAVIVPMQQRQANAKPIAKIGTYTLTAGYFKRYVHFNAQQIQSQITSLQQEESSLQGQKKQAATLAQVQQQLSLLQSQEQSLLPDSLTQVINGQTALQRYRFAGVTVAPSEIEKQLQQLEKSTGGKDLFAQFLTQSQMSLPELRELIKTQLLESKLQARLSKTVKPFQTKVRASHILVKTKALAEQLLTRIKHGANFAQLAKKYSTDTGSAKLGGDLGYFAKGAMVAPFDKAAFAMKVGQIRLVHSQYGWHIIKVTGRERAKLTGSDLSNAQASAYQTWLEQQQSIIGLQKFVKPSDLPGKNEVPTVSPVTNPLTVPTAAVQPPIPTAATSNNAQKTSTGPAKKPTKPKK
jgi:foldase protein PrsA